MNEDHNRTRAPRESKQKQMPEWDVDLTPAPESGAVAQPSDERVEAEWSAFHLRKRALDPGAVNDERVSERPVVPERD